eukprot:TRINITY_DN40521_c0_g1_i1.p1 TRINITY_DN40521_c0_g1~~TRINITY_DN40521_c0_g1_i1.p1  ORF type:complete len:1810 (+),score=279.97 TRINITY_DN40521_c0_g1_i1:604-5430(+)
MLHEHRWFTQVGACFEVHLRHGSDLFWSEWASAGTVRIQVNSPTPCVGSPLRLEDIRSDSVRLCWEPFVANEPRLRALEYKVLCLEFPEVGDTRPEAGGRIVSWRTVDTVIAEADKAANSADTFSYIVRSLLPSRRYLFAIECRYLGLPSSLSAISTSRLEATEPVPCRQLRMRMMPEGVKAEVSLAYMQGTEQLGSKGFNLRLEWRFELQPPTAIVPPVLCYQLRCAPKLSDSCELAASNATLPPALLVERSRADGPASFLVDRSRQFVSVIVELCSELVGWPVAAGMPLTIFVRVGEPSTGCWSAWSEKPSEAVQLALVPPRPVPGERLVVTEQLWNFAGSVDTGSGGSGGGDAGPRATPHAVSSVTLAWRPFRPATTTPLEHHGRLTLQYEITAWTIEPAVPAYDEVRSVLQRTNSDAGIADARVCFREVVMPEFLEAETGYLHKLRIPGNCFQPSRRYFFRVVARYLFTSGLPVAEPVVAEPSGQPQPAVALVCEEAYRPSPHRLPAPTLCNFSPPYDEASDRCVVLLPPLADCGSLDLDPCIVEYREGSVYTGRSNSGPMIVAAGDWTPVPQQTLEILPGERARLVVRSLKPAVCQFRIRRGAAESDASSWVDTAVWRPDLAPGPHVGSGRRSVGSGGRSAGLTGLVLALGVAHDTSLFAHLAWPRYPPDHGATTLQRYQIRYRIASGTEPWRLLPAVDLPPVDSADAATVAERHVGDLIYGSAYEFTLRMSNSLGRWSEWTSVTPALKLELSAPVPPSDAECGGLRLASVSSHAVKVVWRPFCIPCRPDFASEPPLMLMGDVEGSLPAEYELSVQDEHGTAVSVIHRQAVVFLNELPSDRESTPSLEAELPLEPQKSYSFSVRARLRSGAWGPVATTPSLQPRLQPIAVGTPLVDLLLRTHVEAGQLEAALHFECVARGFKGGSASRDGGRSEHSSEVDRKAAGIAHCQVRSCLAAHAATEDARSSSRTRQDSPSGGGSAGWVDWPAADVRASHSASEQLVQFDLPLHAVAVPLVPGSEYIFSLRCSDEYGRWTSWSSVSESIAIRAPELTPPLAERRDAGSNLRLIPAGSRAVTLEWAQFRPRWGGVAAQKGLDAALQRIAYRLRMTRRLGMSSADWLSVPITEMTTERHAIGTLSHEVGELDERYEYTFHLASRWVDMPPVLGGQDWTPEVSSVLLPTRLQSIRAPEVLSAVLVASDSEGLAVQLRWSPSLSLRGPGGIPTEGARHQLRVAQLPACPVDDESELQWQVRPSVLEDADGPVSSYEVEDKLFGLIAGGAYCASVRVGDGHRWSPWSAPSESVSIAVAPPVPSAGDLLEVSGDAGTVVDAVRLEWRPFRASGGLSRLEYKVMALEWPSDDPSDGSSRGPESSALLGRLRRAADIAHSGGATCGLRTFRSVGYVTKQRTQNPSLRSAADRLEWRTEGLKPGMHYRFFICARYAALPLGALLPPSGMQWETSEEFANVLWPDEFCERLRGDNMAWESSLSRFGLWSPIVNTLHLPHFAVRAATAGLASGSRPHFNAPRRDTGAASPTSPRSPPASTAAPASPPSVPTAKAAAADVPILEAEAGIVQAASTAANQQRAGEMGSVAYSESWHRRYAG